jgi:hypothetical protein
MGTGNLNYTDRQLNFYAYIKSLYHQYETLYMQALSLKSTVKKKKMLMF